jgi:hypothetical protein
MELHLKKCKKNLSDVNYKGNKDKLKEKIEKIQVEYPQKLSEVQN